LTITTATYKTPLCATSGTSNPIAIRLTFPTPDQASLLFSYCDVKTKILGFVQRQLSLPGGMDELGQERLAQSIHSSVMALLEGRVDEVGVAVEAPSTSVVERAPNQGPERSRQPEESETTITKREQKPSSTTRTTQRAGLEREWPATSSPAPVLRGWLALGYSATLRGIEGVALGPLLRGGVGRNGSRNLSYGILFESRLIVPSRFEKQGLSIQTSGIRALFGVYTDGRISTDWSLETEITAGLDVNRYVPSSSASGQYEAVGSRTDYQWLFSPAIQLQTRDTIEFGLGVHLDILPAKTHYYTVSTEGENQVVATPWRLQPGISVILKWPGHDRVTR
jgi:hypothetical protein